GYWKARNSPFLALTSGASLMMLSLSKRMSPLVTMNLGCPITVEASVLFPEPFGPIMACISPCLTWKSTPLRISLPSIVAWRSLMSSWLILQVLAYCAISDQRITYVIFKGAKTVQLIEISDRREACDSPTIVEA